MEVMADGRERKGAAGKDARSRRRWIEPALVIAFTLALTLPFIARPFHMDDAGFLELARVRQERPLEVALEDYTFFGQENEVFIDTHPPLISSYQALVIALAGSESETALHLSFLIFPLTAALSMYFLARRFTRYNLWASLLLMASPGVVVMSHGLMSDLPGMAMWLLSIALYLRGVERKSLATMVLCAFALTTGVFISYQVLSVIPLLLVYAYLRKELSVLTILPFVLPLSSFVSYFAWHQIIAGILPRFSYGVGEPMAWYSLVQKAVNVAISFGGAVIFTGALMRVLLRTRWDFTIYATFMLPMFVSMYFQYRAGEYTAIAVILAVLFMPVGIIFIYKIYEEIINRLRTEERERLADNVFLLLWLSGVMFYVVFLLPYSSVRYLLPIFPPAIILFLFLVERYYGLADRTARIVLLPVTVTTAILSLLVAGADYELASANERFARTDGRRLAREAGAEGGNVWFVGEFGFRYYMEQEGFVELPEDNLVPAGDIIIQSPLADPRSFSSELGDRVELVDTIPYDGTIPLRVTNFNAKAGFYGHFWGLLPFSIATGSVEDFLVYRVEEDV